MSQPQPQSSNNITPNGQKQQSAKKAQGKGQRKSIVPLVLAIVAVLLLAVGGISYVVNTNSSKAPTKGIATQTPTVTRTASPQLHCPRFTTYTWTKNEVGEFRLSYYRSCDQGLVTFQNGNVKKEWAIKLTYSKFSVKIGRHTVWLAVSSRGWEQIAPGKYSLVDPGSIPDPDRSLWPTGWQPQLPKPPADPYQGFGDNWLSPGWRVLAVVVFAITEAALLVARGQKDAKKWGKGTKRSFFIMLAIFIFFAITLVPWFMQATQYTQVLHTPYTPTVPLQTPIQIR